MQQKDLSAFHSSDETLKTDGGEQTDVMNTKSDEAGMTVSELDRRLSELLLKFLDSSLDDFYVIRSQH